MKVWEGATGERKRDETQLRCSYEMTTADQRK